MTTQAGSFKRELGLGNAIAVGLASMVGAGVFVAYGPAANAAGNLLLVSLLIAGLIAYCNATSTATLASIYPVAGGTYTYGRERLGAFWGFLAGWAFVIGKLASCAAIAVTVGSYLWPAQARLVALLSVLVITIVNLAGIQKSARFSRWVVGSVILILLFAISVAWGSAPMADSSVNGSHMHGVLQGAGLLFFAFAGYARVATLGEEVRNPSKVIPQAIRWSLAATFGLYLLLGFALLHSLGSQQLSRSVRPIADAVIAAGAPWLLPIVVIAAGLAAVGSLLALMLGISRTMVAMARNRDLPHRLSRIHRSGVPRTAEIIVGGIVAVLVLFWDLRGAIGFSSFGVLIYYAIANAAALTVTHRIVPTATAIMGLLGCLILVFTLPISSILTGLAVLALGIATYLVRRYLRVERAGA